MRKISQCITLYNPSLTGFLLKEDEGKTKCSGIINLLLGVLVDNTLYLQKFYSFLSKY